jgi:hypothetical protein
MQAEPDSHWKLDFRPTGSVEGNAEGFQACGGRQYAGLFLRMTLNKITPQDAERSLLCGSDAGGTALVSFYVVGKRLNGNGIFSTFSATDKTGTLSLWMAATRPE